MDWLREIRQKGWMPLIVLPLLVCLLHVLCIQNYGYFRDELYYLACTKRLAWGYVDHPPFSVLLLKGVTSLLGESLGAIRAPIVAASGLTVLAVLLTARRMGANGIGLWMAGLFAVMSGMYLVIFSFYSMNALDILLWAWIAWVVVKLLQEPKLADWAVFGTLMAVAFMNKASVLWLAAALAAGFVLTPYRTVFKTKGPWLALALFLIFVSPHIVWQIQNGWPTLEFANNARNLKMVPIAPWDFFGQQIVVVNLIAAPFIFAAIVYGFRSEEKKWAPLSIAFVTVVLILLVNGRSRVNYLAPAYTLVLPLVALSSEKWLVKTRSRLAWTGVGLAVTSPLYLCLGLPWLSPEFMTNVIKLSPVQPPVEEKGPKSPMQGWSDMFGWPELAQSAQDALGTLPQTERMQAVVVANNYGEAAAMEHFGVPKVICGHNSYWNWGPQDWNGRVAVFVNTWPDDVRGMFEEFRQVGEVHAPFAVPEQNGSPVWIARGLKVPVSEFWRRIRKYL